MLTHLNNKTRGDPVVTVKDVAKEANVAISTVSNVVNHTNNVSEETAKRVLNAIEKLHYTPNLNGKNLKSSKTGLIGLFLCSMEGAYFADLANASYQECIKHGYGLVVFLNGLNDISKTEQYILGRQVDGAIILNSRFREEQIEKFLRNDTPVVFVDREIRKKTISSVVLDNRGGVRLLCEHLIKLGHRHIGFIGGYTDNYDSNTRCEEFMKTMRNYHLSVKETDVLNGYLSKEGAYGAVYAFLAQGNQPPEAFICANDLMAMGCVNALSHYGLSVPKDVSVVGFDDIELAAYFNPPLTTVVNPVKKVATLAVQNLMEIISGKKDGKITFVSTDIVIRGSCSIRI